MRFALETRAVLSLGANLGDRAAQLERAIDLLGAHDGIRILARSSLWESPAWKPDGAGDAPDYLNAVVLIATTLAPEELLEATQALETAFGRVRTERYGDRPLDIDLVDVGGRMLETPSLVLPHPRAHERQFVLQPWLEVEPDATLPGHGSVAELAEYADGDVWRHS